MALREAAARTRRLQIDIGVGDHWSEQNDPRRQQRGRDPGDLEAGIAAALAHNGPVLIDAVVSRSELAMPPAVNADMAKGFTLYMVKAVMRGRGDEFLDLARANLWR